MVRTGAVAVWPNLLHQTTAAVMGLEAPILKPGLTLLQADPQEPPAYMPSSCPASVTLCMSPQLVAC